MSTSLEPDLERSLRSVRRGPLTDYFAGASAFWCDGCSNDGSEPLRGARDLLCGKCTQAQDQAGASAAFCVHARHRPYGYTGSGSLIGDGLIIDARGQPQHRVHALIAGLQPCQVTGKYVLQDLRKLATALPIDTPDSSDVPIQMPFGNEGRQDMLVGAGRMAIQQGASTAECVDKPLRHDGVSEPKRWKEDLAEGSKIDNMIRIEALQ